MHPLGQIFEYFLLRLQINTSINGLMIFFFPVDEALGDCVSNLPDLDGEGCMKSKLIAG